MTKLHPMLFSTDMVKAILGQKKVMTRRVVTSSNASDFTVKKSLLNFSNGKTRTIFPNKAGVKVQETSSDHLWRGNCKWQKGDVIWVKETYCEPILLDGTENDFYYKADTGSSAERYISGKWRPSIFMPFEAARIFLEVLDVRSEYLFDITRVGAILEGLEKNSEGLYHDYIKNKTNLFDPLDSWRSLWISINGIDSLNANPVVWVISFKVIKDENIIKEIRKGSRRAASAKHVKGIKGD